jgi:hypothetical protein
MAYKQNPGRGPMMKTGKGIPSALLQKGFLDTLKKVGRTTLAVGKTMGNQLADFIQPDADKFGGEGSREGKFGAAHEKTRENTAHQDVIDQSKSGKIYGLAGKLAKYNQDTGYSRSGYNSNKEYNDRIKEQVSSYRSLKKSKK